MSTYSKGAAYERELMRVLKEKGFTSVRVAGSGRARFEQPDLLSSNSEKILGFECKFSGTNYKTINKKEVNDFYNFCTWFGCTPILAFRFPHKEWGFLILNKPVESNVSVKKTDKLLLISEII